MSIGETLETNVIFFNQCSVNGYHRVSYEGEPCVLTLEWSVTSSPSEQICQTEPTF